MTDSPFLALDGAVPSEGIDAGVPAHYGNPIVEQRRLERGEAVVDLSNRGLVTSRPSSSSRQNTVRSGQAKPAPGVASGTSRSKESPVGKVVTYSSVSVDGFVADENDQPGPLFDWLSSGDVPLDESGEVKVSQTSYDYTRPYWDQIGVTIVGRQGRRGGRGQGAGARG